MERDLGPLADGAASLHITRWTIVVNRAQSQAPGGGSALAQFCRSYWHPLYLFARRRGYSSDNALDSTQRFFLHLLEHRTHLLRKRHTKLSREEVDRTALDPTGVDEEIHARCEALVASGGRLGR